MKRRRFLAFSVPALLTTVAGCSSRESGGEALTIAVLELENLSDEEVVFDVAVVDTAGETVFETAQPVAGNAAVALDHPVAEPGDYTITLTTGGQNARQDISLFAADGDSCVRITGRRTQARQLQVSGIGYNDCPS
ncbi:hypothetical protein [Haloarchaeobius sp. HME9146]|uniref:hypothetical protein n=1 Tax=Haloarchaeobius sp. HME9146 TaxID=2978732 RepID=UPI0021C07E44|nr:hypothetical protein [Haloarchaeobius sp. HME9146]MCT9096757.1 hypothetical protein [Haloarchaeobius sp. HME9146]